MQHYSHLAARMIWRKLLEEHPFGRVVVGWYEPDYHQFLSSIHSVKHSFIFSSFTSNHPDAKYVVRHGISEFRPPNSWDDFCLLFGLFLLLWLLFIENVESLWGPIPLARLPPGVDNTCRAVTHGWDWLRPTFFTTTFWSSPYCIFLGPG